MTATATAKKTPPVNQKHYREMSFSIDREKLDGIATRAAAGDMPDDRIPIAISSESPVQRYSWWDGEFYNEILEHSADAVDLSYAADGLPFLDSHDIGQQEGLVEDISIDKDGVLRGMVRFSQRQSAQDLKRDMLDGIRKKISVGYRTLETVTTEKQDDNTLDEVRVVRWMPMEASSVPIPADYSVGVGRSAVEAPSDEVQAAIAVLRRNNVLPITQLPAPKGQERTVPDTANAAPAGAESNATPVVTGVAERDAAIKADRTRSYEIRKLGATHKVPQETVEKWIDENRSTDQVAAEILSSHLEHGDTRAAIGRPAVELNDKERRSYSFARAILDTARMAEGERVPGSFEREIHEELVRKMPKGAERKDGSFLVPTFTSVESARAIMARQNGWPMDGQRAGLDSGTSTKGQELKFTVPGEFLGLLRNKLALADAGITLLAGLEGPVAFPSQVGAATATWVAENPGSNVGESNLTLGQVALAPKSLQASTSYSRQLLAQSVIDVDALVRDDLARVMALALDLAGIAGTGSSNQPLGIVNQSGIGSVALGANGLTPVYNNLVDLETQVAIANADQWEMSYLVHPTTRGTFKKAVALGNTIGAPVWSKADAAFIQARIQSGANAARVPGEMNGYTAWSSAQVPNTLTKGSSSGICLAILFGAFSQFVIGDWGMMQLIVDPYALKKQGMIEVTSFGMYGMCLKYAAALAAIKDALA
jgi:HK97 family phage major capsid protein